LALLTIFLSFGSVAFAESEPAPVRDDPAEARSSEEAAEWDIEIGACAALLTEYVWRGQVLVDDAVFQPAANVTVENFTAALWGNYALNDGEWTELDYILDYSAGLGALSRSLAKMTLSLGYIYYDFPNLTAGDDSQEIYATIGMDAFLSPYASVYWDFDQGDGTYYEVGVSHSVPVDEASLNVGGSFGYNDGQWDFDSSLTALLLKASLAVPIGSKVVFEPGVFYSLALDSQYEDEFYGGLSFSFLVW